MEINLNIEEIRKRAISQDLKDSIYENQYIVAREIVEHYINGEHYGILKAKTQSGKTGVIMAVINILNQFRSILLKLKIDKIMYITGDNQDIKSQAEEDFISMCFKYYFRKDINMIFLKNSDIVKRQKKGIKDSLKNTLVFLDESHFGTLKETNKVPQILLSNGIEFMRNQQDMIDNNTYILSVSATSYKEQENDVTNSKFLVELKTNEKYKGFEEFNNNKQIHTVSKHIFTDSSVCNDFFNEEVIPHLENIKKMTGKNKYAIMRMKKRNQIDVEAILGKYFKIIYVTQQGRDKINYDSMWLPIYENCIAPRKDSDNRPLLFLIKDSFRMGKRIDQLYKGYCGCVIDYSDDKNNVETTVQGLLGRYSGYVNEYNEKEWKDIKFFISEKHYNMLKDYYNDYNINKTPYMFPKTKKVFGNGKIIGNNIGLNYDAFEKNGVKKYDITKYMENNPDDWFKLSFGKYGVGDLKKLNERIFDSVDVLNKYKDYVYMGSRRKNTDSNRGFFLTNSQDGGDVYLKEEYVGKPCYKSLIYVEDEKVYIEIRESFVDTYVTITENSSRVKEIKTMTTKNDNDIIIPIAKNKVEIVA